MDIIADALTKIRNAGMRKHKFVEIKKTNMLESILKILQNDGYIKGYKDSKKSPYSLSVELKYTDSGKFVIEGIKKISKPSLRVYSGKKSLPRVYNNFGIAIISTSKGLLTDKEARSLGVGGEVICYIW